MRKCTRAVLLAVMATVGVAQELCNGRSTCEEVTERDAARASAMLQVKSSVHPQPKVAMTATSKATVKTTMQTAHLNEARNCVPMALQEAHVQSVRQYAALLATGTAKVRKMRKFWGYFWGSQPSLEVTDPPATEAPEEEGDAPTTEAPEEDAPNATEAPTEPQATTEAPTEENATDAPATDEPVTMAPDTLAPVPATEAPAPEEPATEAPTPVAPVPMDCSTMMLDAAGFKAVTSLCCPHSMEAFFGCLLGSMGMEVCSKPHVQGLMHWFTCVPDMDFQYMLDVINNGNPCKYWGPIGETCPVLSAQCAGHWCR